MKFIREKDRTLAYPVTCELNANVVAFTTADITFPRVVLEVGRGNESGGPSVQAVLTTVTRVIDTVAAVELGRLKGSVAAAGAKSNVVLMERGRGSEIPVDVKIVLTLVLDAPLSVLRPLGGSCRLDALVIVELALGWPGSTVLEVESSLTTSLVGLLATLRGINREIGLELSCLLNDAALGLILAKPVSVGSVEAGAVELSMMLVLEDAACELATDDVKADVSSLIAHAADCMAAPSRPASSRVLTSKAWQSDSREGLSVGFCTAFKALSAVAMSFEAWSMSEKMSTPIVDSHLRNYQLLYTLPDLSFSSGATITGNKLWGVQ